MTVYKFVDNYGRACRVEGSGFDVDTEGLYVYNEHDKVAFLEKGTFGAFVVDKEVSELNLAGAWDEGFKAGRHTSESNKNPYKESK